MGKKQTAVEWLVENIPDLGKYIPFGVSIELHAKFQQAKEMEKQQIIDAFDIRKVDIAFDKKTTSEQYYEQTYGGNNEKNN
jgi:hypothetical protein